MLQNSSGTRSSPTDYFRRIETHGNYTSTLDRVARIYDKDKEYAGEIFRTTWSKEKKFIFAGISI